MNADKPFTNVNYDQSGSDLKAQVRWTLLRFINSPAYHMEFQVAQQRIYSRLVADNIYSSFSYRRAGDLSLRCAVGMAGLECLSDRGVLYPLETGERVVLDLVPLPGWR